MRRMVMCFFKTSRLTVNLRNLMNMPTRANFIVLILILNLANNLVLCNDDDVKVVSENMQKNETTNESQTQCQSSEAGEVWSLLLEDYVLSQGTPNSRHSKDLPIGYTDHYTTPPHMNFGVAQPNQPLNYHSSAYKRPGNIYITRRVGEAAELEPHMRKPTVESPAVNPQFRPMTNQMLQQQIQQQQQQRQQPGFLQQLFGFGGGSGNGNGGAPIQSSSQQQQMRPVPLQQPPLPPQHHHLGGSQQSHASPQTFRAVSENDLYLLGAIEKLVYRVDYLESRIRRAEQLIYYLMAGNNQKEVKDPCPANFTRISDNCYYINSHQQVNWKTANSACKALNAHLAEFERGSENEEIMAYLLNQPNHRGRDYWLGGLNPGLLWIWSNSAKPVNPNMNLTSIAMTQNQQSNDDSTSSNLIDDGDEQTKKDKPDESILNNTLEIMGQGRCLRLSYNASKHSYAYFGQECTSRHHYICEAEDKTLDNKIKKITRDLKLA